MNLQVIEKHDGYGIFPLFPKGTMVSEYKPCEEYAHWYSCVIDGHETFVADVFVSNGVLNRNYNPTELIVEKGQIVMLIDLVFEWLYVKDENDEAGWLPASNVISV